MTLQLVCFMLLSLRGLTLAILFSMDSPTKIWQNFSVYKILLPGSSAASLLLTTSHPFFKVCTGYLSTHASLIKSISSPINPKLDSLPLIYLISFTSMFHHGLYAPHLSPFFNFHAEFLPNPMAKDHSLMLPPHYGTTYHSKSVLPIMWTFSNAG